ncbi:hypothetical protein Tco_0765656 [Tanacetum coccineum]
MGDTLGRKERVKSRRVRGMILAAQSEVFKQENVLAERLHGLDKQMERKGDKSVVRLGKKGKLAPRYVGPFEILERTGLVAYRLRLPEELIGAHDTFHVLNLKKCLGSANLHVPLNEIKIDKTLCFFEEPVEIMDREIKIKSRDEISIRRGYCGNHDLSSLCGYCLEAACASGSLHLPLQTRYTLVGAHPSNPKPHQSRHHDEQASATGDSGGEGNMDLLRDDDGNNDGGGEDGGAGDGDRRANDG